MHVLLRNCKIIDPSSTHHLEQLDIRIKDGIISEIGRNLPITQARELDFAYADFGAAMLSTTFSARIFGLTVSSVMEENQAALTFYQY